MEDPDPIPSLPASSYSSSTSFSFSSASRNGEVSGSASTWLSYSQVREEEHQEEESDDSDQPPQLVQPQTSVSYHSRFPTADNEPLTLIRDDTLSCIIVVLTFWFFVSMTLILGVYGAVSLQLGPNCSLLIKPNPLFVDYLEVEQLDETVTGQMLYGFYKDPPLDVVTNWSETHSASLPAGAHKEWLYILNKGSQINISYSVNSPSAASLILIIAQGNEGFAQWLQDPSYPNTTLSWNNIHENGLIQQDIMESSSYFIAVGNLNSEVAQVQLNVKLRASLYNTTEAYYKCPLASGRCSLKLFFPRGNAAVLTTSGPKGTSVDEWYVKLSYGPRWITYVVGIAGMTILMLLVFRFFNHCRCIGGDRTGVQYRGMGSERSPLLSQKDDDMSSWGSSYDSVSQDDEDPEDGVVVGSLDGKSQKDGEYNNNTRRLCAICFDAPRDCFFLPCGHCVACFACGTRIAEAVGTCPICRRNMKKVRKIFTV